MTGTVGRIGTLAARLIPKIHKYGFGGNFFNSIKIVMKGWVAGLTLATLLF